MAKHGLDACVHCGFCLQACPTYLALGDENDSPRGRIVLMRALVEGTLDVTDPSVGTHIDRCLGCRACETACPSGVPYGELLEATRATLAPVRPVPVIGRIVLRIFATRWLLAPVLWLARALRATGLPAALARLPGPLGGACAMLAATQSPLPRKRYTVPIDGSRGTVAVLRGCVMHGLFKDTNDATARTLTVNDYRVVPAAGQRCCGALHAHAGDLRTAAALARVNVAAFERAGADWIAINAAGCGAMVKEYGHLLADDPAWAARAEAVASRARDVSELLAAAGPKSGGPLAGTVTYDAPCHSASCAARDRRASGAAARDPGYRVGAPRRCRPVLWQRRHLQPPGARARRTRAGAQAPAYRRIRRGVGRDGQSGVSHADWRGPAAHGRARARGPSGRAPRRLLRRSRRPVYLRS